MSTTFANGIFPSIGTTGIVVSATAIDSAGVITISSTAGLIVGMSITFSGTAPSGFTLGTYYILTIPTSGTITVSATRGGSTYNPGAGSGTMAGTVAGVTSIITSTNNSKITVVGLSLTNTTPDMQFISVQLVDGANGNIAAYYAYNMPVPAAQTLKLVNGGERLVLGSSMTVNVSSTVTGTIDVVASYVVIQ